MVKKLTEEDLLLIWQIGEDLPDTVIAEKFGVSHSTIQRVYSGACYADVEIPEDIKQRTINARKERKQISLADGMTPKMKQCLALVCDGLSVSQISSVMKHKHVKSTRAMLMQLYRYYRVNSKSDLIRVVLTRRIKELEKQVEVMQCKK